MPQEQRIRGSGFRCRPLAPEVVEAPRSCGPSKVVLSASRALARREEDAQAFSRENVELHLKDRGATLFDFFSNFDFDCDPLDPKADSQKGHLKGHLKDHLKGHLRDLSDPWKLKPMPKPTTPATPSTRASTASRAKSSRPPSRPTSQRFCESRCSVDMVIKQKNASSARRARMHELQRGMIDHDEERLADIARGTSPLLGARGQAMLPVPPVEVDPLRMPLELRLRLAAGNKICKSFRRPWLMAVHTAIEEARDLPFQHAVLEAFEDARSFDVAHPRPEGPVPRQDYQQLRRCQGPQELLQRAEELIAAKALEDECMPIAWRCLATAYDATPPEVLMMLRHVKSFARAQDGFTASSRKELEQIADELLHSLTSRLQDATAEFLLEVTETMNQCEVGSAAFSDLVQLLARRRSHAPEA